MIDPWLTLAELGLEPGKARRLLDERNDPDAVLHSLGHRPESADLERLEGAGCWFVNGTQDGYPAMLRELPDAPRWLYGRGVLPAVPGVAIVGSRRASAYGLRLAEKLGSVLGSEGWPVISGLALGIDAAAHRGTLAAGGTAVAVLGCGVDVWYPRTNARLGEEVVAAGGAVVSEYPLGAGPEPWRFPLRNRIISGLSGAVIVVEAAVRSGALITARHALDQGREVFAVPGDLGRSTSEGTNLLIRDGAHPLTDLATVAEAIELAMGPPPGPPETVPDRASPSLEVGDVAVTAPVPLDDLILSSGRPASEVLAALGPLELEGRIRVAEGWVIPV